MTFHSHMYMNYYYDIQKLKCVEEEKLKSISYWTCLCTDSFTFTFPNKCWLKSERTSQLSLTALGNFPVPTHKYLKNLIHKMKSFKLIVNSRNLWLSSTEHQFLYRIVEWTKILHNHKIVFFVDCTSYIHYICNNFVIFY